jgi:RHS repeat-associated protein
MATATTGATATSPTATYVYTEFGAPESGAPGAYGWLGADQISSDALGGQLLMGARAYNANTGRFSQTDPIPGGSANAYDYTFQNPLTDYDLTGAWSCYGGSISSSYETCQEWLNATTMDRLALGALTVGVIFAFCASTPICALLLGIETVIAGDAAYYDAADHHGNGAFLDVYLWRVVWEYPDFGWGGFYWAWGHSHWVPYWASIS